MKLNRICRLTLMSACMLVLATILVSEAGARCDPDTCYDSSSLAVGFYGRVSCAAGPVGAGVYVCFINNANTNWHYTCTTDAGGYYYLYPEYAGTDSCNFAPTGWYSAAANQCNSTPDCYKTDSVNWTGGLQEVNFLLDDGPDCSTCP
jgi:hypothetical protein